MSKKFYFIAVEGKEIHPVKLNKFCIAESDSENPDLNKIFSDQNKTIIVNECSDNIDIIKNKLKFYEFLTEDGFYEMTQDLVPNAGLASTEAGEILRAYQYIEYRFYNDGDTPGCGVNQNVDNSWNYLISKIYGYNLPKITTKNYIGSSKYRNEFNKIDTNLGYLKEIIIDFLNLHRNLFNKRNFIDSRNY